MTEPTALQPEPPPAEHADEPSRQPPASASRSSFLPWLTATGFLVLAAALFWLWYQSLVPQQLALHIAALAHQVADIEARLTRLEQRPSPTDRSDLASLTARVIALEQASPRPSTDLAPLAARVTALEQRSTPPAAAPSPPDLGPLEARIKALEASQDNSSQWAARVGALENTEQTLRADLTRQREVDDTRLGANEKAQRHAALIQAASLALSAGQKLGNLVAAPPALARFADVNPPTDAALRLAFPGAAREALAASRPVTEGKPVLVRLWAQAQDLVTIRQGDHVLVGDPAAGILERARTALDAGDLATAATEVAALSGPAAVAMAGWLAQARSLLEARAALVAWAASD
jgi:hypothetical protein